ncbi:hypothetical protein SRHO_G00244080 [Serrasalmus rhombeus]
MARRISPLQDSIHHVITKTDKTSKLEVKYINPLKGRGVFSLAQFSKRDFVVEYRGDRIDFYEAQRRRKLYHRLCTVFMFDFKWKGKMWCIDAAREDGSFGRLVNDDHKHPNCRMKMIEVDGRPHLCLFAIEDIKEGDEITYDYGGGDWPWRKKVREDTVSKSNIKESQPSSLSEPVLSTCSSASDQVREDTVSKSNIKESQPSSLSEPVLSTCSSASDQVREDTVSKSNIKESQPSSLSEPVLSTCSSASDQVREDTVSKSNIKESQPSSLSEPVLSTCSSASDQVREDTVSKSNIKESQPSSLSEPVLSTCSSASDQRTGKNTISENSAQENYQLLQSGPVLSACSSASDQRTKKDTISEISAQENCLPLQSRPALSACSSASDKMRNSNPEKTAWVTPMSRQSEPLKDHSNNSSSGQSSSSGNTDDEHACVPKLRRTRSILMRGFVPEDSDELFDSTSDSGEEYVPDSRDERNESSSESSTSRKPVKWSCLSSVDEATPSNLVPHSTSSGVMGVTERSNLEVMDLNKSPEVIESDGVCSSSELVQEEGAVVVNAVRRKCDGRRAYDKKHYCLFCLKPFSKMARHLQYVHSSEREVAIACSFPKGSKQRKMQLDNLRHRGNFVHNASVIKTGKGELIPCKRPPKKAQGTDFMHCAYCQGLFTRNVLWRHMKVCKLGPEGFTPKPGKNRVQSLCAFTQPVPSHISKALWKALSLMHADEITAAVKNDSCIIQLGEHLLNKGGSTAKHEACVRQKLRELGKLLITGRNVASLKTMEDFIHPQNYMKMVQAVRHTCGYDSEANTYKTPSLAKKLGISLMKLSKLMKAKALIAKDHCLAQNFSNFQEIHKERWCELISATAARNLEESKWNAPTVLPFTEDVQKLHAFLNKMQDELIKQLSAEPTSKYWSELAKVALTQIILFNRRREGEVSCMLLSAFLSRDSSDPHDDIDWALSEVEKKLCRHFSRIVIRGKRGRPVPILLTPKMLNAVELLVKNRETCGVLKDNVYLFARPSAMSHYRGSDCIRSFAKSCNANSPDALTSTKLRKHAATLSTVLNLKDTDMDQLANFLGHDIRIHREYYRLPEKTLQLAKVSKVLMALEQGRLADFKGKNLDEINIDPNEEMELIDDDEGRSEVEDETYEELGEAMQEESAEATQVPPLETALISLPERKKSLKIPSVKGKTHAQKRRKAWEVIEIQAVERHLKNFITSCRVPGKVPCEQCIRAEPSALKNRDWQSVKFYVHNRIVAYKRDFSHNV